MLKIPGWITTTSLLFEEVFRTVNKKQIECQNWWLQWLISITLGSWWIYAVRPFKIRRIIVEFLFRFKTLLFLFFSRLLSVFFAKNYWKYGFFCVCHYWIAFQHGYISKPFATSDRHQTWLTQYCEYFYLHSCSSVPHFQVHFSLVIRTRVREH